MNENLLLVHFSLPYLQFAICLIKKKQGQLGKDSDTAVQNIR
jgi:hypothetical protein